MTDEGIVMKIITGHFLHLINNRWQQIDKLKNINPESYIMYLIGTDSRN